MLSAKEANSKTFSKIKAHINVELFEIEQKINEAIDRGKYSITCDHHLKIETRKKLEELGYKVAVGHQYNDTYYNISW